MHLRIDWHGLAFGGVFHLFVCTENEYHIHGTVYWVCGVFQEISSIEYPGPRRPGSVMMAA